MFALFTSIFLFAAEGRFTRFYNAWFNIPGFELWKFINLFLFVAIMVYLVKRPLSDAFKAKRDQIRAELIKAEEEKHAALARLTAAEARSPSLRRTKETSWIVQTKSLPQKRCVSQPRPNMTSLVSMIRRMPSLPGSSPRRGPN